MTATRETLARSSSPLPRAVRAVDRWGLVAGLTAVLANVLLAVLFLTPADGPYAWTGPANDVVDAVSTLAMIPVAAALIVVCGDRPGLGAVTSLAILAMVAIPAGLLLLVIGLVPSDAQTRSYYVGLLFIYGWVFAASRAGRASGRLPRQIARCGLAIGAAGLAGAALLVASVPTPANSLIRDVTFGTGSLATGAAVLAYPFWLVVLSYRIPAHLADHVGERAA